jgi:hypothetical protein
MAVVRASRLATALLLAAIVTAAAAFAADTARADHHLLGSRANGGCLRTNLAGNVSLRPCLDADQSQHWQSWDTGWVRNVPTGYCLHSHFPSGIIDVRATARCNPNEPTQWWYQLPDPISGWSSFVTVPNGGLGAFCLIAFANHSEVYLRKCTPDKLVVEQWVKLPLPH